MNLTDRIMRRKSSAVPQLSERDRLAAELEYEAANLPELELLVRLGRRTSDDLTAKREQIASLQTQLAALDIAEREIQRIAELHVTELPGEEAQLVFEVQDLIDDLNRVREKARSIVRRRADIITRFSDFKARGQGFIQVPLKNRQLLPLTSGEGTSLLAMLTETVGVVANWLQEARAAGFRVPAEPRQQSVARPQHAAPKLDSTMTAEERRVRARVGTLTDAA